MTALTAPRNTIERYGKYLVFPVAASKKVYEGSMIALSATGYATPGATATTLKTVGVARDTVDNSAGADGALTVAVKRGVFRFDNSASGDAIALTEVGSNCYLVDDQTVAKTNGSNTRSVAGVVRDVDALGVWVEF